MKIKDISINAYGNIKNKDIKLKDGINIILGNNESGKSTLLNYILSIFYGISKNKDGKTISDYDRYKPWTGEDFSGKITYTLDNGNDYEVYRDFNKKSPKIYNSKLEDISSEFEIDKKDGSKFFFEQTGVDKQTYLSTVVSSQQEVRLEEKDQNLLVQKIANLAGTGDDNISYKKAVTKLDNKIKNEIGNNRTSQKPINMIEKEINRLEMELDKIKPFEDKKYSIYKEKQELIDIIKKQEEEYKILKELKKQEEAEENKKSSIEINEKNIKNNLSQIEELKKEKTENEEEIVKLEEKIKQEKSKKVKPKYILFIIILIALIGIIAVNSIFIKKALVNIISAIAIALNIIIGIIINIIHFKKQKQENNKKLEEYNKKYLEIDSNIAVIDGKIDILQDNSNNLDSEIKKIKDELESNLNIKKEEITSKYNKKSFISLSELEADLTENKIKLKGLEIEEKNILPELDKIVEYEEQIQLLKENWAEFKNKEEIINIAIENLDKAYEEMKTKVTPKFTANLSKTVSKLTNDKYNRVSINDEHGMMIENEKGDYIPIDKLSTGTIDELYLSLRFSMINEIGKETMPIILDETFAYFDDNRLKNILQYLAKELKKHQVIILTCTNREKNVLDNIKQDYNLIQI